MRASGDYSDRRSAAAIRAVDPLREAAVEVMSAPGLAALHKGDPNFETPAPIAAAAAEAVRQGFTHYPPPLGDNDLRAAIAGDLTARTGRVLERDDVVITVGAIGGLAVTLLAYLAEGDEALLLDPSYSGYAPLVRQAGATPVRVAPTRELRIDLGALDAAITPATKLLVVCNPVNPTGVVYTRAELEALAMLLIEHDLLLVADEVYDRLVFDDVRFTSVLDLPQLADRTIYVNSFSKTYAMTGWRIGYVAAAPPLLVGPATLQRNLSGGVSWPAQRAALAAVQAGGPLIEEMLAAYAERREALTTRLARLGTAEFVPPEGAFYVFPRFVEHSYRTSAQLTQAFLRAGVIVRNGAEFGPAGEGHVRLSYSADLTDIELAVERIATVLVGDCS
jgi:aspartate aminotransferase